MPPVTLKAPAPGNWEDGDKDPDFKPLSREEAARWRSAQPRYSPWSVLRWQAVLAVLAGAVAWGIDGRASVVVSVLYGAAAVVLPTAVMAWGVTSSALSRWFAGVAQASLAGFFLWEGVKLLLSLAMLWSAPRIVAELNWLALLAGLVVVLKAHWLELGLRSLRPTSKS